MCPEFWVGFREGIDVFHRNERAPRIQARGPGFVPHGTRDISCGKRRREKDAGRWVSLGLVINAYLHGLFTRR
jgi:hypothetical protein